MAPSTQRPPRRASFARAGHRSPASPPSQQCCHQEEWLTQSVKNLILEVASLKADKISQCSSSDHRTPSAPPSNAALGPAKIHEIEGDLFVDAPADASFGHCVGGDYSMGAGIAPIFKKKYGQVEYLKSLNLRPGQVACLPVPDENGTPKYVMYLVTKPRSARCRPEFADFCAAVNEMATLCRSLGISTLALPRIGAGLDHLWWPQVLRALQEAFRGVSTDVLIFSRPSERPHRQQMSPLFSTVAATPPATRLHAPSRRPPGRQEPREAPRHQQNSPVQRVSPSNRLANDLRKRADRGAGNRTEFNARARKGDRYVSNNIGAGQSKTNPLCSAQPSEAPRKPDAAVPPVPGRGGAHKAAAATVDSTKGGSAERSTEACELTGALSPSAPSPTPQTSGEPVPFSTPEASPTQGAQNAAPEVVQNSRVLENGSNLDRFFKNLLKSPAPAEPAPGASAPILNSPASSGSVTVRKKNSSAKSVTNGK